MARSYGLAVNFVAAVAGLTLAGWWLDGRFDTSPWCLLGGLAVGLIGGTYNLLREWIAMMKRQEQSDRSRDIRRCTTRLNRSASDDGMPS